MARTALIAVLAAAALAATPAAQAATLTIKVTSVSVSIERTDIEPKGTSKGDTIQQRNRLMNVAKQFGRPKGAVVGSDHGTMTFTSAHTATFSGIATLPGGTVQLRGEVLSVVGNALAIPVTGGTGRFAAVRGYVLVGAGDEKSVNTYVLTLPGTPVA